MIPFEQLVTGQRTTCAWCGSAFVADVVGERIDDRERLLVVKRTICPRERPCKQTTTTDVSVSDTKTTTKVREESEGGYYAWTY